MAKKAKLRRGFYWRGPVIWVRTDPLDKLPRSSRCTDPDAAYAWEAERQRQAQDPAYRAAKRATLQRWVDLTIDWKKSQRSGGTVNMYETKLGHALRIFGADTPLPGAPEIDAYIAQRREEGAKDNTIARELTCIGQMLKLAWRSKEYLDDPRRVMPIGFSPNYKPTKRTLKRTDLPKLLGALMSDEQRAWVCMCLTFAADPTDIEAMRPEHYDRARNAMAIYGTKTETRAADIPVLPQFRELFDFALPRLPVTWPSASTGVGQACRRAGLPHLSPKDLRRSACSWLFADGVPDKLLSRFMRHASEAMIRKVYAQYTAEELEQLIADSQSSRARELHGKLFDGDLCTAGDGTALQETCSVIECPGTELNRRHEDFQFSRRYLRPRSSGWFGRKRAASVSAGQHDATPDSAASVTPSLQRRRSPVTWSGRKVVAP